MYSSNFYTVDSIQYFPLNMKIVSKLTADDFRVWDIVQALSLADGHNLTCRQDLHWQIL